MESLKQILVDAQKAVTENSTETVTEEKKETTPEVKTEDVEKKKKHSFQSRIDALTAKNKQFEEQLAKIVAENEALKSSFKKEDPKPEEVRFETVEDLEGYLKKVATKEEISEIVAKIVDERLSLAKESVEKETKQQAYDRVKNEFSQKMYDFYSKSYDEEYGFDEETQNEARQIFELFEGNPNFYLEKVNKFGFPYLKKFINGEFEAEQKADKIKTVVDKALAVRTNTDTASDVRLSREEIKGLNLREILKKVKG